MTAPWPALWTHVMIRTLTALIILVVVSGLVCISLLLIGLVHPSRRLVAALSGVWSRVVLAGCGVGLTVVGADSVADQTPRLLVGNHQSALDIPVLFAAVRGNVRFLAKKSLFRIPMFGWAMGLCGHVPIDRRRPRRASRVLEEALARFKRHPVSLAVFPEGTRSRDGRMLPFRGGAMKIIQRAGLPVVPFSIHGTLAVKSPDRWLVRPGPVRLTFGEVIPAEEVAAMTARDLNRHLSGVIAQMLNPHDAPALNNRLSPKTAEAT